MTVVLGNWEDEGEDNLSTGVPNQSGHDSETPFQKQTVTIYLLCIKHVQGKKKHPGNKTLAFKKFKTIDKYSVITKCMIKHETGVMFTL